MTAIEKIRVIVFLTCVAVVYASEFFLISVFALRKLKRRPGRSILRRPMLVLHALAIIGIVCLLYGRFIEPYRVQVNTFTVRTEKLSGTSFRLVQISDLHCDKKPVNEHKMVEIVNSLQPDIIVFTGDALNTRAGLPRLQTTLKALDAGIAKLAVRGNFEVDYWPDVDVFGGTGFEVLDHNTVTLEKNGESISISGLSCEYTHGFERLLASVPGDRFSVFLYHYPDLAGEPAVMNADLYLCGHTHGGQVALPFYGALVTLSKHGKKYESGMYNIGDTVLYVNRGIGLERSPAPKVRFFARPEIAVFEIMPVEKKPD